MPGKEQQFILAENDEKDKTDESVEKKGMIDKEESVKERLERQERERIKKLDEWREQK